MSRSSHPFPTPKPDQGALPQRRLLTGLALLTLALTLVKVVAVSAPMPTAEAPERLRLAGYRIRALPSSGPQRGRDLSLGTMRQFRLVPLSGEPPLTLTLLPIRGRTVAQLSKTTLGGKDLGMEAVGALVPGLSLQEHRLVVQPVAKAGGSGPQVDQLGVGRGAADPAGSTTRLQTCLTSSGLAAVSDYQLRANVAAGMTQNRGSLPRLLRIVGLQQAHYGCLAVQLESGASAAGGQGGRASGDRQGQLEAAWRNLREVLVESSGKGA